jgi:DNA-binding CsgD family transcriptional regulator
MISPCGRILDVTSMGSGDGHYIRGYPGFGRGSPRYAESVDGRTTRGGVVVSGREAEVFDLVGEYLTHVEIGERLFISVRTVESHVASLRRKLGMIDHRSLVQMAVEFRSLPPLSALPHEASSFLGRSADLDEVADAVASSRARRISAHLGSSMRSGTPGQEEQVHCRYPL